MKLRSFTFAILVCLNVSSAFAQQGQGNSSAPPVIVTSGMGSIKLKADQAWVSIAVDARAGKAVDARSRAATQMTAVQTAIKAVGIPVDALKTSGFSLEPQTEEEYGAKVRVREYSVKNEIEVRVDNLDLLGEVLDAAGAVKTSDTLSVSVAGLRFTVRNSATADKDALTMAVKDAMSRASAMAAGAGRTLGEIVRIEEQPLSGISTDSNKSVRIQTRSGTNAPQFAPPSRVDTPVEPNQIEFLAYVTLTIAVR